MNFNMVLGVFHGDWHQAAELYRRWFEQGSTPPRIADNPELPAWYRESPVVVTYPVRGVKDTGSMDPNEYFPYVNAIPHLERLSERFDSKVMALLMHWEGSAPWAPPYIWPPYGEKKACGSSPTSCTRAAICSVCTRAASPGRRGVCSTPITTGKRTSNVWS
ncbi:DUF6259 domain-containing protein [Cohnella rhizosphaerae]|nr:DUF6259 domain-containing protein [Cohnella rhizosphaerae]MDG0813791.1 DUF6259 domain-containing protein [Cohnella rhizosphaerae]